tara:strand:- start:6058 stop:6333 length:276 start_codon:yes stop_codon:yes gene_type:complete
MKLTPEEIFEELKGFCIIKYKKEIKELEQWTDIKYIDKVKQEYRRGGYLFSKNLKLNYIVLQGKQLKKGKPVRWSVQLKNSIIFHKKAHKK